jgi:hypothetical protein
MDLSLSKLFLLLQYRSWNKIGLFQSLLKPIPFENALCILATKQHLTLVHFEPKLPLCAIQSIRENM